MTLHYTQVQNALSNKIEKGDFNKSGTKDIVVANLINRNINSKIYLEEAELILCSLPSVSQETLKAVVGRLNLEIQA